uniref:DUF7528 family protein n=1 Tax=Halocatena halophila TaxID=2814576 RepID=UPI002ED23F61
MFDSFESVQRLYHEMGETFSASDLDRPGLTGGRTHLLVRHFAEHPAFDCELCSQQPLTVEKRTEVCSADD